MDQCDVGAPGHRPGAARGDADRRHHAAVAGALERRRAVDGPHGDRGHGVHVAVHHRQRAHERRHADALAHLSVPVDANGDVPLEEHPRPPVAVDHGRGGARHAVGHHELGGTQVTGATDGPHGNHAADGDHASRGEDAGSRAGAHHLGVVAAVGEEHGTLGPGEQRALPVGTGERQPAGERRCGVGTARGLRFDESGDPVHEHDP